MTQPPAALPRVRPAAAALPLVLLLACGSGCVELSGTVRPQSGSPAVSASPAGRPHPAPPGAPGRGQPAAPAGRLPEEQPALDPPSGPPAETRVPARPEESVRAVPAPSRQPAPAPRPSPVGSGSASAARPPGPSASAPAPGRGSASASPKPRQGAGGGRS